jgi:hypothetical protein
MHTKFWSEKLKGRNHSDDLGMNKENIIMDLREIGWEGVDWIRLDQDRNQWQPLVNMIVNLQVPKMWGISLSGERLSATQGFFSM